MKKRLLSALLALALVFVLLPTTALAETTTTDVYIAGGPAVVDQWTTITANSCSGSYYYNAAKKELTLKGVNITSSTIINGIQFAANGDYTIKLEGENKISNVSTGISTDNVKKYAINVILSGSGSLDISARGLAIEVPSGNLTFNNTGAITLATTNTTVSGINAIQVSGSISIGNDFNKNLEIKAGEDTFDLNHSDFNALNNHKTITIAPKPSKTYYNNTALKYGETKPAGSGTISCDENGAVTLTNVNDSTGTLVFYAESKPSSITLIGDSTLSAVETKYQSLTISGSGSLTVGSIRVPNNTTTPNSPSLTIDGARVTAGTTTSTTRAVEVKGDLTVKNKATLIANSKTDSVPTVQVGGNATFTGSTVTITNYSTTQGGQDKDSYEASSALHVDGAITISGGSVTAGAQAGGNAIRAVGDITVSNGAQVTATNHSQYFSAITAGKADSDKIVNVLSTLIVSGENTNITATNSHDNSSTGAIHAKIKNANASNYLKLNNNATAIAPNAEYNTSGSNVTITRGAAYETPQAAANYTIAGKTMYVGQYYKTDASGNISEGTAQDYNIFCVSKNDFTLNNATISSTGTGGSTGVIITNLDYSSAQIHIKLIGTNSINNAGHHAILGEGESRIIIENAENASNASLTISGNYLPVYSYGDVTINAEVVIKNTNGELISTNKDGHANGAFDLGSGYKCYASTSTTGTPLEEFNSANYSTYRYLRVTTQTLDTDGGSTHDHVWDEVWHDLGNGNHAHKCTGCDVYDTATQEQHVITGHENTGNGSHYNVCGNCGNKAEVGHSYTWVLTTGNKEMHTGTCICGDTTVRNHTFEGDICKDCGYNKSTGTTCEHEWVTDQHWEQGVTVFNDYHYASWCSKCHAVKDKEDHTWNVISQIILSNGQASSENHSVDCKCKVHHGVFPHEFDANGVCVGCGYTKSTTPGTIVIIRPAEEEKPAQQPNPSTGANDLVGLAVAAAVAAALGSAALLRKHD